jgi:hypothetical protein
MITPKGLLGHVLRWPDVPTRRGIHPPECPACKVKTAVELAELMEVLMLEPRRVYDKALRGVTMDKDGLAIAVYDIDKCLDALMAAEGWDADEAWEWLNYNTIRACEYTEGAPALV